MMERAEGRISGIVTTPFPWRSDAAVFDGGLRNPRSWGITGTKSQVLSKLKRSFHCGWRMSGVIF